MCDRHEAWCVLLLNKYKDHKYKVTTVLIHTFLKERLVLRQLLLLLLLASTSCTNSYSTHYRMHVSVPNSSPTVLGVQVFCISVVVPKWVESGGKPCLITQGDTAAWELGCLDSLPKTCLDSILHNCKHREARAGIHMSTEAGNFL